MTTIERQLRGSSYPSLTTWSTKPSLRPQRSWLATAARRSTPIATTSAASSSGQAISALPCWKRPARTYRAVPLLA